MDRGVFEHSRGNSNASFSDVDDEPVHAPAREGSYTASTTAPALLRATTAAPVPVLEPSKLQHAHVHANGAPKDDDGATSNSPHGGDDASDAKDESGDTPRRVSRTERDEAELKALFSQNVIRISFFLWCQGLINNFHYNMVISGANSLAANFGMTQYVALISFMNVFFGIIARIMNAFVAHRISYNIRMTLMSCGTIIGLLIVSFAGDIGGSNNTACFVVLLVGVAFTGTSYSYGETVALSFVQRYPPNIVGAWGSGTGISGVITALLFIALTSAGLSLKVIFLITLPLAVCYWFVFCFGLVAPHKVVTITYTNGSKPPEEVILHRGFEHKKMRELEARVPEIEISDYSYRMIMNFRGLSWSTIPAPATMYGKLPGRNVVNDEDVLYSPTADAMAEVAYENADDYKPDDLYYPCCRFMCGCCSRTSGPRRWWGRNGYVIGMLHNKMFWFFFNLAVVYVAEYAAQFMAPFSFYCKVSWKGSFWINNSYTITQFCYQLGVFISRSSLMCIKIPYVGVISILQVINAVGWLVQAKTKFISIHSSQSAETGLSFLLFAWMLFVGLLGGASYVNVFYLILCRGQAMQQKEEDEAIRQYLESRPALANDNTTTTATAKALLKVAKPASREGIVEDRSCATNATNTTSKAEVVVTAVPVGTRSAVAAAAANPPAHIKKRAHKKDSKSAGPTSPSTAAAMVAKTASRPLSKEVEGRIMHSDSDASEDGLFDAESASVTVNPDADPTLIRLGMANRKLSDSEADEIELIRNASAEEWQRRRELSMSMGSLYAMGGICIGTILDVIFTNTILTTKSTCVAG
jgi:battenin